MRTSSEVSILIYYTGGVSMDVARGRLVWLDDKLACLLVMIRQLISSWTKTIFKSASLGEVRVVGAWGRRATKHIRLRKAIQGGRVLIKMHQNGGNTKS